MSWITIDTGATVAGPVLAKVTDISPAGAGLTLSVIRAGAIHLFCGPKEDPAAVLALLSPDGNGEPRQIRAIPVWFNKDLDSAPALYRLGVEFLEPSGSPAVKELLRILGADRPQVNRWLRELIGESW